jgi:hypothetical protein
MTEGPLKSKFTERICVLESSDDSVMRQIPAFLVLCCTISAAQTNVQKPANCKAGDTKCVSEYLLGPNQRLMTVTALEYREANTEKPYLLEGKAIKPEPTLYYKLACKRGGSDLVVGKRYKVTESRDENNLKILMIALSLPDEPNIIGVECEVQSVTMAPKERKR